MINQFFAPLLNKIFVGVIAALLLALAFTAWRADSLSEQRDEAEAATITEKALHGVTRASLASLEGRLAVMVRDGELRAERLSEALEDVAEETAPLRSQAEALERGEIDITEVEGL